MSNYIDRKQIAALAEVSTDAVRKNEIAWGLVECKVVRNQRSVVYRRRCAMTALSRRGLVPEVGI